MADWDGKTERRADNQVMMHMLANMDKNLALAVQELKAQGVTVDKHVADDKDIQGAIIKEQKDLAKQVDRINIQIAKWIGGGAVVMAIAMPIFNRVIDIVIK